jgi:hypothetical protein
MDLSPAARDVNRRLAREALDALEVALAAASGHALVPGAIMAALEGARSERALADAGAAPRPFTRLLIAWRTARRCAGGE